MCKNLRTACAQLALFLVFQLTGGALLSYAENLPVVSFKCDKISFSQCINQITMLSGVKIKFDKSLENKVVQTAASNQPFIQSIRNIMDGLGENNYAISVDKDLGKSVVTVYFIEKELNTSGNIIQQSPLKDSNNTSENGWTPQQQPKMEDECAPGITCRQLDSILKKEELTRDATNGPSAEDLEAAKRPPSPDDECAPGLTCRQMNEILEKEKTMKPDILDGPSAADIEASKKPLGPDDECAPGLTCRQQNEILKQSVFAK